MWGYWSLLIDIVQCQWVSERHCKWTDGHKTCDSRKSVGVQGINAKELSQKGQWELHQATADRVRYCLSIANWFLSWSGLTKGYRVKTNPKQLKKLTTNQTTTKQTNKQNHLKFLFMKPWKIHLWRLNLMIYTVIWKTFYAGHRFSYPPSTKYLKHKMTSH